MHNRLHPPAALCPACRVTIHRTPAAGGRARGGAGLRLRGAAWPASADLHNSSEGCAISLSIALRSWQNPAIAGVAKLVDARDLKSLDFGHAGSIPAARTIWPDRWGGSRGCLLF